MSFVLNEFMLYTCLDLPPPNILGETINPSAILKINYASCRSIEFRKLSDKPGDSSQQQGMPTGSQSQVVLLRLKASPLPFSEILPFCPKSQRLQAPPANDKNAKVIIPRYPLTHRPKALLSRYALHSHMKMLGT